jgi:Cu(I)/Ag(I) efflux system membrane fusion protein
MSYIIGNGRSNSPSLGERESIEPVRSRWQRIWLIVKVVELRLRFIALLAATGLAFAYWDTIWNHYEKWMRPTAHVQSAASGFEFYCPMHPHVVQENAGSCPLCGMTLSKRAKNAKAPLPEGVTARVLLTPDRVSQAGIGTVEISYAPLAQTLTTVGNVAIDERRVSKIVSKIPGKSRVETLYANVEGARVSAGQPLAELFSPELNQAIQELQTATRRAAETTIHAQSELGRSLQADRQELVRASVEKLTRWGITQEQVDAIVSKGQTDFKFTILSPVSGHVFRKSVVEGQEVQEGYPMFEVVDLQSVWVQAQIHEHELALVHAGQAVEATVEAFSGETFAGTVDFIQPRLDTSTRTVEVRFTLGNPSFRLLPGMFATVTLKTPVAELPQFRSQLLAATSVNGNGRSLGSVEQQKDCPVTLAALGSMGPPVEMRLLGRKVWTCCSACTEKLKAQPHRYLARFEPVPRDQVLSVPEAAVIDTGTRKIVYVEVEPGVYEGREVVLGKRIGDRYPVLEGLAPGERVAGSGAFLIDAESRLNPPPDVQKTEPKGQSGETSAQTANLDSGTRQRR